MRKPIKIAIAIIIIIGLSGLGFFYYQSTRVVYNNNNAVGNTAGNLNNGGLFCEYDGKIYFANPYDKNMLYVMDSDCSNAKKLKTDSVAYLNVCGNYIYYVKNNFSEESIGSIFRGQLFGVYRTTLDGKHSVALYNKLSGVISLCGNTLFYQHYDDKTALSLYKIGIDKKNNTKISDTEYNPASMSNGLIYFADPNNKNNISTMNPDTNNITKVFDANAYLVDAEGNYIYYIDIAKGYALVRLNASTKTVELLYSNSGKIVNYNVYGNKIFFQMEGDNAGLYRMNIDGTQVEFIASGNLTNIHCTSKYTFFQYYENQGILYRVPTTGTITQVEEITIK